MTFWAIDNPRLSCFAFLRKWIRTLDWFLAQWKLLVAICLTWKSGWNDLWRSVLGEVVGMSYHQSWPRHQTRKRHHSLQVCQPILPFISNNINKDGEQERIEWTSSIFGVQNKLLKPHEVHWHQFRPSLGLLAFFGTRVGFGAPGDPHFVISIVSLHINSSKRYIPVTQNPRIAKCQILPKIARSGH